MIVFFVFLFTIHDCHLVARLGCVTRCLALQFAVGRSMLNVETILSPLEPTRSACLATFTLFHAHCHQLPSQTPSFLLSLARSSFSSSPFSLDSSSLYHSFSSSPPTQNSYSHHEGCLCCCSCCPRRWCFGPVGRSFQLRNSQSRLPWCKGHQQERPHQPFLSSAQHAHQPDFRFSSRFPQLC